MKAYVVLNDDMESRPLIIWAKTAGKAKEIALTHEEYDYFEFVELRAIRTKWADGMQNMDSWSLTKEQVKHGWRIWLTDSWKSELSKRDLWLMNEYHSEYEMARAWENGEFEDD